MHSALAHAPRTSCARTSLCVRGSFCRTRSFARSSWIRISRRLHSGSRISRSPRFCVRTLFCVYLAALAPRCWILTRPRVTLDLPHFACVFFHLRAAHAHSFTRTRTHLRTPTVCCHFRSLQFCLLVLDRFCVSRALCVHAHASRGLALNFCLGFTHSRTFVCTFWIGLVTFCLVFHVPGLSFSSRSCFRFCSLFSFALFVLVTFSFSPLDLFLCRTLTHGSVTRLRFAPHGSFCTSFVCVCGSHSLPRLHSHAHLSPRHAVLCFLCGYTLSFLSYGSFWISFIISLCVFVLFLCVFALVFHHVWICSPRISLRT